MTSLYVVFGIVAVAGLGIWFAIRAARAGGRAEAEAEHNQKAAENAETMGRVMAEHRTEDVTRKRLGDGSF